MGCLMSCKHSATTLTVVAVALLLSAQMPASAETIVVDGQVTVAKSDVTRPTGGMTMKSVETRFGSPLDRHPTVGKPPITRWDYDHFAVFFEQDRVIDAVVLPTSSAAATPSAVSPPDSTSGSKTTPAEGIASAPAGAAPAPTPAAAPASTPAPAPAIPADVRPPASAPSPTPISAAPLGRTTTAVFARSAHTPS